MDPFLSDEKYQPSLTSFRNNTMNHVKQKYDMIPHRGALFKLEDEVFDDGSFDSVHVCIEIGVQRGEEEEFDEESEIGEGSIASNLHQLRYNRHDFDFAQRLFAIIDAESHGIVDRKTVKEFVTLRCPVFWKRDDDIRRGNGSRNWGANDLSSSTSPTFDELWKSVAICSTTPYIPTSVTEKELLDMQLGVEGWMVFCRFIALAQYLEAKRKFSARHLQQTMRHLNSPQGSELVVVDVPPPEPPSALSPYQLAIYERKARSSLPLPELDLDHSLVAAHEESIVRVGKKKRKHHRHNISTYTPKSSSGIVKVTLFGPSPTNTHFSSSLLHPKTASASSMNHRDVEFIFSYAKDSTSLLQDVNASDTEVIVVKRSLSDIKWLDDTFSAHKVLGGTLCGRILPPFPGDIIVHGSTSLGAGDDAASLLNSVSIKNTTDGAIAVAAAGVGLMRDVAKSLWDYAPSLLQSSNATTAHSSSATKQGSTTLRSKTKKKTMYSSSSNRGMAMPPESYYNPNSPEGKARQIERYLNYLLQHAALSTSFPLNTILKASQSGLVAAKQTLDECSRKSNEVKDLTPQLKNDGKILASLSSTTLQTSLPWVRTAAQAAMALQVHGILETTGLQTASARLQHASLPSFVHPSSGMNTDWVEDDGTDMGHTKRPGVGNGSCGAAGESANDETMILSSESEDEEVGSCFEEGVISVQSELQTNEATAARDEEGYDLLPLPVPAPERRILNAGSSTIITKNKNKASHSRGGDRDVDVTSPSILPGRSSSTDNTVVQQHSPQRETRFHYGTSTTNAPDCLQSNTNEKSHNRYDDRSELSHNNKNGAAYLGDISVDEHIDKLREVIGSVDNTLSRCLASSGGIGRARKENLRLHLNIVRGLDSWFGLRGRFVSQRALLKGITGIEQSKEVFEESDLVIIDDVSWQSCLAHSAVSAAEDVRSAIRASKTASNAKSAADTAACAAQKLVNSNTFNSIDEARAAQTRASMAQSHAFHATVVEHEANAAKRRAALALAHDVKYWNVHRKLEMLKACMTYAKSQHEATRRAVDAWSCLRDGYIGTDTVVQSAQSRKSTTAHHYHQQRMSAPHPHQHFQHFQPPPSPCGSSTSTEWASASSEQVEEVTATIYHDLGEHSNIVAVDHDLLTKPRTPELHLPGFLTGGEEMGYLSSNEGDENDDFHKRDEIVCRSYGKTCDEGDDPLPHAESILPLVKASPIPEECLDFEESGTKEMDNNEFNPNSVLDSSCMEIGDMEMKPGGAEGEVVIGGSSQMTTGSKGSDVFNNSISKESRNLSSSNTGPAVTLSSEEVGSKAEGNNLDNSASFGDNISSASMQSLLDGLMSWGGQFDFEDDFALPAGMAASIVLEESCVLNNNNKV